MKKMIRFYSKNEANELKPFISKEQAPTDENLKQFCVKYKRNASAVRAFVYAKRKVKRSSRKLGTTSAKVTKNEFVIPISKWEIRNEGGNNSLVLYFQK